MRRAALASSLALVLSLLVLGPVEAAEYTTRAGNKVVDRAHVDTQTAFYLVDQNHPFTAAGQVNSWAIWAENSNQVQLVIYRQAGGTWSVVGKSDVRTPAVGHNRFDLASPISVAKGDFVGLHFPGAGSVSMDLRGSSSLGNLTGTTLFTASGAGETAFTDSARRTYSVSAFSLTADARRTVAGNSVVNRADVDAATNFYLVDRNRPFTSEGTARSWEIWAENTNQVQLVIYRKSGGVWSVVGKSDVRTPAVGYNRFNLTSPIPVAKGDFVGLYFPGAGSVSCDVEVRSLGDLSGTVLFTNSGGAATDFRTSSKRVYSLRASYRVVEQDQDGDDGDNDRFRERGERIQGFLEALMGDIEAGLETFFDELEAELEGIDGEAEARLDKAKDRLEKMLEKLEAKREKFWD